jgi:hypothetical protein
VEKGIRTRDEMQLLTQPVDLRRRWDMQENVPDMRKNHRVLRIDHAMRDAMRETLTRRECVSVSGPFSPFVSTKGPPKIKFLPSPTNSMSSIPDGDGRNFVNHGSKQKKRVEKKENLMFLL